MISFAVESDMDGIINLDRHIARDILGKKIVNHELYVMKKDENIICTLRYSLFWDNTPFLNMIYVHDKYQKEGYGTIMLAHWEEDMKNHGYKFVMTSTLSNETAQHFYRKNGYKDVGGFVLPNEALELLLIKDLSARQNS